MDSKTIALSGGLLFLLLAIVGGGFSIREISMPKVPRWGRVVCLVVGVALVAPWFTEVVSRHDSSPVAGTPPREILDGETIIHQDRDRYVSPDGVEVSGLVASVKQNPPAVGDRIWI